MGGPPPPEWATSLIDPASDPILAPTLGVTIEGGEGAAAATTSTTSRSTRKRPRSLSPGPSNSKKQHKLLNDMPDSLTLIEQLQSTNTTIRNEALNKLMKVSCSHDVNYALGIHGDDILDALVHIVYQCLNWKPKEALSADNSSNNANDTSNASTLTKGTFVASTAWMSPPHPDAQLWADHCIYEYHKLRGQTDLASQERSQLLDSISVILRNLSYVAANLRLLAYNPKVLQILIGFLYDCGNTTHLISSIGDSALETVSSSSSSSTATSNSSSLALHSLQTFVHLAPYLDLTGQKMYADRMFLIPDKLDAEGLLPHSNSTCSMYGQARQNLGWGGMWLAKRLDVKEDVVLDTSPELILEHTEPYLCSVWSLFPALTHVMKTTTSPRTVIMTAMDFIKELLDHHSSVQDGDNDSDDEEEEEDDNSNDGATNENNEGKDNNDSNDKDVPIVEQQEMMGIGEDQYKKPNPKKQQKNKKGKSATTKRKVSLPNPRKVLIHVPDVILDRLVDLLWVPRLGPDSLEYLNPINNIVSRVSTLKLLMGYDATVDTDLRDRSLDVLVPLLDLSSPKLARRLGLVDRTNKITNKTTTSSNDDDDKPTTIAPPRMTTRTRLYDALVPALTTTVGRNDAPNLASVLFGQLGKAKENRIGLLYVQSRLLKLASRDPRAAQLACNQLYVDHDVASLQTKKSDNNYVEGGGGGLVGLATD